MNPPFTFDSNQGLVTLFARIEGPIGFSYAWLALDTGATTTMINTAKLVSIGYDPASSHDRVEVTTGSGIEFVPRLTVQKIQALGQERESFPLIAHTLPPSASVDGLLGLDFFRGRELRINFRRGQIVLR